MISEYICFIYYYQMLCWHLTILFSFWNIFSLNFKFTGLYLIINSWMLVNPSLCWMLEYFMKFHSEYYRVTFRMNFSFGKNHSFIRENMGLKGILFMVILSHFFSAFFLFLSAFFVNHKLISSFKYLELKKKISIFNHFEWFQTPQTIFNC
jgi:hypothetical protein